MWFDQNAYKWQKNVLHYYSITYAGKCIYEVRINLKVGSSHAVSQCLRCFKTLLLVSILLSLMCPAVALQ